MKLSIKMVNFSYEKKSILKKISLDIEKSKIICLVGPNGSGKTTLIRCIDRILEPKGSIFLDGRNIRDINRNKLAQNIAYVPQFGGQIAASSVLDVVMMGRTPFMGWKATEKDIYFVEKAIKTLNLEDFVDKEYNEISGGQKQKVLLARAIAQNPQILLLDEPTNNLDIRHQLEALSVIHDYSKSYGITVIMAIHDLTIAARYADYLAMLKNGELIAYGTPDQLITTIMIRDIYGVEAKIYKDNEIGIIVTPIRAINQEEEK